MTTTEQGQVGLADALREQTRHAHEQAESSPFVSDLLAGRLPLAAYTALVAQNYAIYQALEGLALRWRDDPVAGAFVFDELTRVGKLEHDLAALLGSDWSARASALQVPATARYVAHLNDGGADWPGGFIAHHYVRYLGDLSGGQAIRVAIERIYGDAGRGAVGFYVFEHIERIKPFRDLYRQLLDRAPIGAADQMRVVAEATVAFELNRAVFIELAAGTDPDAVGKGGEPPTS
jgi:heme oxygenase